MNFRTGCFVPLVAVALLRANALAAQALAERPETFVGAEFRVLSFERLPSLKRLRQLTVPIGVILPLGRFRLDVSSAFVSTELTRTDSTQQQVDHLTDTQVRGAYVFGRDAVVATVVLNLPSGPRDASARDYAVIGAVSPALLGFPVAAYANGFSATGGLAAAVPAGRWSLGIAGSLRLSSRFTPYVDSTGPITYKPGIEGRIRAGADGLVGSSRVSVGFTYSTFGDDQFGSGGSARGEYRPGPRWLAETALLAPIGSSSLNLSLWNFHRTAGDTTGASARNRENLAAAELSISIPLGPAVTIEPALSGRFSKPEAGRGRLLGAGAGFRIELSERVSLIPTARYDAGWVESAQGFRSNMSGGYGSVFLRIGF